MYEVVATFDRYRIIKEGKSYRVDEATSKDLVTGEPVWTTIHCVNMFDTDINYRERVLMEMIKHIERLTINSKAGQ